MPFSTIYKDVFAKYLAPVFDTGVDNHLKRRLQIAAFTYFVALSFQISNVVLYTSGNSTPGVLSVSYVSIGFLMAGISLLFMRKHSLAIYAIVSYMIVRQNISLYMHLEGFIPLNAAVIHLVSFALVHILDFRKSIVAAAIYSGSLFLQIVVAFYNGLEGQDSDLYVQFLFVHAIANCWGFFSVWSISKAYNEREQAQEKEKKSAELYARHVETLLDNKKQLLVDVSHELRTPLSVLRANIEAMEDGINQQSDSYPVIHRKLSQIDRLIHDIYFISKYDNQQFTLYMDSVSVTDLVDELKTSFQQLATDKDLTLVTQLSFNDGTDDDVVLEADWQRLVQLYSNLLQNSIDYTDPGGQITLSIVDQETGIRISVQDTAPGVPSAEHNKLFDRLYRRESSRSRATGGAGLGLSICRAIVEAHNGSIEIESSTMGGLAVTTWLPLTQPQAHPVKTATKNRSA